MFVGDNSIASAFNYLLDGLKTIYDEREALQIAAMCFESRFKLSRADLVIKANDKFSESELLQVHFDLKKLKQHIPVQYVLGESEFFGLTLHVDERVLIPRPETEELVQWAIDSVEGEFPAIADLCTGSGCIALALKSKFPKGRVWGTDVSSNALEVARENGKKLGLEVNWVKGDLLEGEPELANLDMIVSNPPYIPETDRGEMEKRVLDHEPELALFAEGDALGFYRAIAAVAAHSLNPGGVVLVEIHEGLHKEVMEILENEGLESVEMREDMQGKPRMVKAWKSSH